MDNKRKTILPYGSAAAGINLVERRSSVFSSFLTIFQLLFICLLFCSILSLFLVFFIYFFHMYITNCIMALFVFEGVDAKLV